MSKFLKRCQIFKKMSEGGSLASSESSLAQDGAWIVQSERASKIRLPTTQAACLQAASRHLPRTHKIAPNLRYGDNIPCQRRPAQGRRSIRPGQKPGGPLASSGSSSARDDTRSSGSSPKEEHHPAVGRRSGRARRSKADRT